jgi:hypothetical protein
MPAYIPGPCTMILLLLLSSCWHHKSTMAEHHKANIDYAKFWAKVQGTWISYEYILNLNKTKSPSQSAAFMEGIFSFTIDSARLMDDTLHCIAWVNGHEDRGLWVAFDAPDSTGRYSIGIKKNRGDENELNQISDNITRIKIDSPYLTIYTVTYDSVRYVLYGPLPRGTAPDYPLRHYTTAALFRGKYQTKDSNTVFNSSSIYFDPRNIGKISGSEIYDSFDINVNVLSKDDSVDYMELFDSKKQYESRSFIYKIKKNILRIYSSPDSMPCILFKMDIDDTLPRP